MDYKFGNVVQCTFQDCLHFYNGNLAAGCEFDCMAEQNAPHFRHFATQISTCTKCIAVFYNVKSYTNLSLMMNEQKIALQNFQVNLHPAWQYINLSKD